MGSFVSYYCCAALIQCCASTRSVPCSFFFVRIFADLILKLFDTLGHAHNFLLECCFLSFEIAQLLVQADRLRAHHTVVSGDFFLDAVEFVSEGFTRVLAFHGEYIFESFLFTAQDLDLFLVHV